jgi:hypothetical protein
MDTKVHTIRRHVHMTSAPRLNNPILRAALVAPLLCKMTISLLLSAQKDSPQLDLYLLLTLATCAGTAAR